MDVVLSWLDAAAFEMLLFAAAAFCIVGIDDLLVDMLWLVQLVRRWLSPTTTSPKRERSRQLNFAIVVPAWDEANVIASMVRGAAQAYRDEQVTLFICCYSNDQATISQVKSLNLPKVIVVVNAAPGPTTKGDGLNAGWLALLQHERESGTQFDCIVIHDAEDVVHDGEAHAFAAHLADHAFVQLPVVPLPVRTSRIVAGHYCDEFAEAHLKSLVVREMIGASIPSAGVGCAIRRDLMAQIAAHRGGLPFSADSLTEDYELGLLAHELGTASAFVRMHDSKTGDLICTRSRFPHQFRGAVRQKSRWIAGIALAGWDRMGWSIRPAEIWMRWRDRRSVVEAAALVCAYAALAILGPLTLVDYLRLIPDVGRVAQIAVLFAGFCMIWRLLMRCICTTLVYGWREGLLALPRVIVSNAVAIVATVRAVRVYLTMNRSGKVIWEKTDHSFPEGPIG
jgi:bacteriophage N4 adsorption protein B